MTTTITTPSIGDPTTKRETQRIDTPHEAYTRMQKRWQKCRDLMEGTEAIRRNAAEYLPMLEGESEDAWEARVLLGALFNGFERTVLASVGMLAVNDPTLSEETPPELVEIWDNVDGAGTHGVVFASMLEQNAIIDGHAGIFVDMASIEGEKIDTDAARRLGLRPYWILVTADDEWLPFFEVVNGRKQLTMLIRRVRKSERDGAFGLAAVVEFWLYVLVKTGVEYSCYRTDSMTVQPTLTGAFAAGPKVMSMSRIPYARLVANGDPTDVETKPPLLTLADLNIEHHQTKNGILSLEQLAFTPTQVRIGAAPDKDGNYPPITRGPRSTIEVPRIEGVQKPVYWDSPDVNVLEPAMRTLKETELAMEVSGSAFMASQTRAQETAAAKKINAKAQNATLARVGRAAADCLTNAMSYCAEFLGLGTDGGKVTVNTDFEDQTLDPQAMSSYVAAVKDAGLPPRILLEAWQRGGRIDPDADLEELEREMLADAEAQQAAQELDAALMAERMRGNGDPQGDPSTDPQE
jgi:hypothetical protein